MRFCLAFGLLGGVLAVLATRSSGLGWPLAVAEAYLAACFLTLAIAYGLRAAGVEVEGRLRSPILRAILFPYLALGALTLFIARRFDREGLLNPLAPGLYVGRLPFPSEVEALRAAGIGAVLNLCWEFPRLSRLDRDPAITLAHLPILDASPPTDAQFREANHLVARWRAEGRIVLIHCAQGHGRTATIASSVLLRLGLARDAEEALAMILATRPLARPSKEQKEALLRYTSNEASTRPD